MLGKTFRFFYFYVVVCMKQICQTRNYEHFYFKIANVTMQTLVFDLHVTHQHLIVLFSVFKITGYVHDQAVEAK